MNGRTNTTGQVLMGLFIPLEPISDLNLVPRDSKCLIQWTDPVDKYTTPGDELVAQWQYTIVVRKENSAPTGPTDGVLIVKETTRNQYAEIAYEDTGLNNGTTYYYALYAYTIMDIANEAAIDDALIRAAKPVYLDFIDPGYNNYAIAATSNHILFGGGYDTNAVIAYDNVMTESTLTGLNRVCRSPGGGSLQGYAYFVEGANNDGVPTYSTIIYSYDSNLTKRPTASAPSSYDARMNPKCAASENILYFAGGRFRTSNNYGNGTIECVDIAGTTSMLDESCGDGYPAAASNGHYAIFQGRYSGPGAVDYGYVYDDTKTLINITSTSIQRGYADGANIGEYTIFGGGQRSVKWNSIAPTTLSDAFDVYCYDRNLTKSTIGQLSTARYFITALGMGKYVLFVGGDTYVSDQSSTSTGDVIGRTKYVDCFDSLFTKIQVDDLPSNPDLGVCADVRSGPYAAAILYSDELLSIGMIGNTSGIEEQSGSIAFRLE